MKSSTRTRFCSATVQDVKSPATWELTAYKTVVGRVPRPGFLVFEAMYIILVGVILAAPSFAATQPTNSPAGTDFSAFKIIPDKNIFNPRRYARSAQAPRETRTVSHVDTISLVGIMSYEKGPFAFFEGTRAEYRKVLKQGDSIAGYKLTNLAPNSATLSTTTNQLELRVGMRLRREENGPWQIGTSSEQASNSTGSAGRTTGRSTSPTRVARITAPSATTTKPEASDAPAPVQPEPVVEDAPPSEAVTTNAEPAAASESTETDPVLRRLIERRNQELNR